MSRYAVLLVLVTITGCRREPARRTETADPRPVAAVGTAPPAAPDTKTAFDGIYRDAVWGRNEAGVGNSGTGSTLTSTAAYRTYLQAFLAERKIVSVVDAGCGDWEFSKEIDWTGIEYKGFDIVDRVVDQNRRRHGKPNIQFFAGNIVDDDLPPADLLVCKHVLQHLPTKDVQTFLRKQLPKYKYALITNGVDAHTARANYTQDIAPGGYRALDITKPPYAIPGAKVLAWNDGHHDHEVILVVREP